MYIHGSYCYDSKEKVIGQVPRKLYKRFELFIMKAITAVLKKISMKLNIEQLL